jgi:hypothetical protein
MPGFTAFVDESGCDGFEFDRGSTDFLVIGAIICRTENIGQYADALTRARTECRKPPDWQFKSFKRMGSSDGQRWRVVSEFAKTQAQVVSTAIYKPGLDAQGWRDNAGDLYFQASKFLIERISWACRDTHLKLASPDPFVRIVFSERGGLRYDRFRAYMERLRGDPAKYSTNAAWEHLDPNLIVSEPHDDANASHLAADYLASSIGTALERRDQGVFDDRFARLWADRFYHSNGRRMGNGFKVWPDAGLALLRTDPRGHWLKTSFGFQ